MYLAADNKQHIERYLKQIRNKAKSRKEVAHILRTTEKTVGLWYKTFAQDGTLHCRKHIAVNKIPQEQNEKIINRYDEIINRNIKRFGEARVGGVWKPTIRKIAKEFQCSREHIRKVLVDSNRICHRTQRKTKKQIIKNLRQQQKNTTESSERIKLESQILEIVKHDLYVGKSGIPGFRNESDGCFDNWINEEKQCLYLIVDSMSNHLLNVHMEKEETSIGHLILHKGAFTKFGRPEELRTDNRNGLASGKLHDAIVTLGIRHESSSNPTFKPNVERANEVMQCWLPDFLAENNINSVEEFNSRKQEIIDAYNTEYNYDLDEENCFVELGEDEVTDFVIKENRKVANDVSHISFENQKWAPFTDEGKRILMSKEVTVNIDTDNEPFAFYNGIRAYFKQISNDEIIFSEEHHSWKTQLEFEKRKIMSINKMLDKKIESLRKHGVNI